MSAGQRPLVGAAWMSGSILSFTAMAVAGREMAAELDSFEIMFYRSLIAIVLVLVVAGTAGTLRQVTTRRLGLQFVRNVSHFAGQNLWLVALTMIPLAQVFALEFTTPLWVALLAPLMLGERLTRTRAIAAGMGFFGILIVARPDFGNLDPGILVGAAAAIGFAGSALFTKQLTRTESITCILFWMVVMQAAMGLVMAGYDGQITPMRLAHLPGLTVLGAGGVLAHFCLTKALINAPASVVLPVDFLRLPLAAALGMALYAEALDPLVFVGGVVIVGANLWNLQHERRAIARAQAQAQAQARAQTP